MRASSTGVTITNRQLMALWDTVLVNPGKGARLMRIPLTVMAATAIAALVGMSAVGCGNDSKSSTPASGSSAATPHPAISDYTTLLIKAGDIKAPDAFTAGPAAKNPNGQQGATVTFTDSDQSHSIIDTIQVLPDIEAAPSGLESEKATPREAL